MKVRVLVISGYGLNCEEETAYAFGLAGGKAAIIHINDLIAKPKLFDQYQILVVPGGFSYGDDTGAGLAFANRLKNNLWRPILKFAKQDKLIIGICNGFQIIANLGLLPAFNQNYGQRLIALTHNDFPRYSDRWVDLKVVTSSSPWLKNIKKISLPIAHGEGKFYTDKRTLNKLKKDGQISLKYTKGEICQYQDLPGNPNGSIDDIAGITDPSGRILGLMPHPERAIFFTQLPDWPLLKEKYIRSGKKIPKFASGLQIFKNGVNYFSSNGV